MEREWVLDDIERALRGEDSRESAIINCAIATVAMLVLIVGVGIGYGLAVLW